MPLESTMNRTRLHTLAPLLAATLTLGSGAAFARDNTQLDRVEIAGQSLRVDVTRTCSNLAEDLSDALARSLHRVQVTGDYQVRFDLKGDRISAVQALGGNIDHRQAVRSAMRKVDCQDAQTASQAQRFVFQLAVRSGDEPGGAQRFAIRELSQPLTASAN